VAKVDHLNRHCQIVARRLGTGSVVPFLGAGANLCERPPDSDWEAEAGYPPSGAELAAYLSTPYGYPETDRDLLRVAQWVDLVSSPRALVDELHAIFSRDYQPNQQRDPPVPRLRDCEALWTGEPLLLCRHEVLLTQAGFALRTTHGIPPSLLRTLFFRIAFFCA
jgi:hypothetical protein